jgi:hypothetical protein
MYPTEEGTIQNLGASAAKLLATVGEWVTRRKETVTVLDEALVRRHMSVDFELPRWVEPVHRSRDDEPVFYAPLFMLQKGSDDLPVPTKLMVEPPPHYAAFDVRSSTNEALSLPPRVWNAAVSIEALLAAARTAEQRMETPFPDRLWIWFEGYFRHICTSERNEAVRMIEELREADPQSTDDEYVLLRDLLDADATLDWLLEACAKSSVAMVPLVGREACQGVLKVSYNEQIARFTLPAPGSWFSASGARDGLAVSARLVGARLGWAGVNLWIDTPFIGAGNYHVEIQAPHGLEIYDAGLIEVAEDPAKAKHSDHEVTLSRVSAVLSEVHLYAPGAAGLHGALSWTRFRVRRQEMLTTSVIVGVLISAVLWVDYILAKHIKHSAMGVPELLLLFPGAVAAYVAKPGPHRLTARMLGVARLVLLLVALTPYVAATALAFAPHNNNGQITSDSFKPWLLALAVVASAGSLILATARLLPQPTIRRQRFAKWLGWPWMKKCGRKVRGRCAKALASAKSFLSKFGSRGDSTAAPESEDSAAVPEPSPGDDNSEA